MQQVQKILKEHTMKIVLVLVFIFFTIITPNGQMFDASSFDSLIKQNAYVYILAIGMLMCMLIKGNIDLSVGSAVFFVDAIGAILMKKMDVPVWIAMLVMVVVGLAIGALIGWVVAFINIPPWIVTLAGYLAFRGWATALTDGQTIGGIPEGFTKLFAGYVPDIFGNPTCNITCIIIGIISCIAYIVIQVISRNNKVKKGYEVEKLSALIIKSVIITAVIMLFAYKLATNNGKGIPYYLIWVVVVALIYNFILSKTTLGRVFYAMGGNVEATRLSGINTKLILFFAYLNMQFLTVIAAWMAMTRFTSASSKLGLYFEMDAISACIVGGVSAYGGSGTVFGAIIGATLIGVINLGMSLVNLDNNWQKVVKGLVLLVAVVFEIFNNRKKTKA